MTLGSNLMMQWWEQNCQQPTYVKDGLELWLDGIDNTRAGHSTTTTVWEDLSGHNRDWQLNSGVLIQGNEIAKPDASMQYIAMQENPGYFGTADGPDYTTIEYCIDVLSTDNGCFFVANSNAAKGCMQYNGVLLFCTASTSYGSIAKQATVEAFSLSCVYQGGKKTVLAVLNGASQPITSSTSISNAYTNAYIGGRYAGSNAYCGFHSFRVYSRALTEAEIQHNYAIDKARFNIPDAGA